MIKVRKYRPDDAVMIDEIYNRCHQGTFSLPNMKHVIGAAVVEKDGLILGFGCLELIPEAVLIIDTDKSLRDKVITLKELEQVAEFAATEKGFDKFYMFPSNLNKDEPYINMLIKHFEFIKCPPILCCSLESHKEEENG